MRRKYNYENMEEHDQATSVSSTNKLTYLLVGGGIGALVALLFAPKAGQELRGDIADATRKGYDKTLETAQQLKEQSGTYYQQIKEQAGDAYSAAASKLKNATQDASDKTEQVADKALSEAKDASNQTLDSAASTVSDFSHDFNKTQHHSL